MFGTRVRGRGTGGEQEEEQSGKPREREREGEGGREEEEHTATHRRQEVGGGAGGEGPCNVLVLLHGPAAAAACSPGVAECAEVSVMNAITIVLCRMPYATTLEGSHRRSRRLKSREGGRCLKAKLFEIDCVRGVGNRCR